MLSACIATLKRAVPLLTWTEILIISPHPLSAKLEMIVTCQLYVTILTESSENMLEREEFRGCSRTVEPGTVGAKIRRGGWLI
jgi:hypothetical protein